MDDETLRRIFDNTRPGPAAAASGVSSGDPGFTYSTTGHARYYCPALLNLTGGKHHEDMTPEEWGQVDGDGHMAWDFHWDKGAYHLDHEKNGGIPKCSKCGKTLVLVKGDDPHAS